MTLDIDATLLDAHSEKEDAAPTYKGGFGFCPMLCFLDRPQRPWLGSFALATPVQGEAAAHEEVLDRSLAQLPAEFQRGRRAGDDAGDVHQQVVVRTDSAGASHRFVDACIERNLELSIGFPIEGRIKDALLIAQERTGSQPLRSTGRFDPVPG